MSYTQNLDNMGVTAAEMSHFGTSGRSRAEASKSSGTAGSRFVKDNIILQIINMVLDYPVLRGWSMKKWAVEFRSQWCGKVWFGAPPSKMLPDDFSCPKASEHAERLLA